MAGLGLIATGLALANFRDTKAELEVAEKAFNIERAALAFEINRYNSEKYKELEEYNQKALNPDTGMPYSKNDPISNVEMIPLLNVYSINRMFVQLLAQRHVVYVNNQSNREITIHKAGGQIKCYNSVAIQLGDLTNSNLDIKIAPNSITELSLSIGADFTKFNNIFSGKEYAKKVIEALKKVGGVTRTNKRGKTITTISNGTIIQSSENKDSGYCYNACTMDLEIMYSDSQDKNVRRALYKDIQGSICYVVR